MPPAPPQPLTPRRWWPAPPTGASPTTPNLPERHPGGHRQHDQRVARERQERDHQRGNPQRQMHRKPSAANDLRGHERGQHRHRGRLGRGQQPDRLCASRLACRLSASPASCSPVSEPARTMPAENHNTTTITRMDSLTRFVRTTSSASTNPATISHSNNASRPTSFGIVPVRHTCRSEERHREEKDARQHVRRKPKAGKWNEEHDGQNDHDLVGVYRYGPINLAMFSPAGSDANAKNSAIHSISCGLVR